MFNPPHPGNILKELYFIPLELTITEAAQALCVSRRALSYIINEKAGISSDMAIRLSTTFEGTDPEYWLNLQQQYDIWRAKKSVIIKSIKVLLPRSASLAQY